jgi:hypothetical protein
MTTNQTPMLDCSAEEFLDEMAHRSYAYIGAALTIRAHLFLCETHRIKASQLDHILRVHSPGIRSLIDSVIDGSFSKDIDGYIFSHAVDRATGWTEEDGLKN